MILKRFLNRLVIVKQPMGVPSLACPNCSVIVERQSKFSRVASFGLFGVWYRDAQQQRLACQKVERLGVNGKPTDEVACYRAVFKVVKQLHNDTLIEEFGPMKLKEIRSQLVANGYYRKFVNSQIGRIKHMMKWGVENELVSPPQYEECRCVAGLLKGKTEAKESNPVLPVEEQILIRTLAVLPSHLRDIANEHLAATHPYSRKSEKELADSKTELLETKSEIAE